MKPQEHYLPHSIPFGEGGKRIRSYVKPYLVAGANFLRNISKQCGRLMHQHIQPRFLSLLDDSHNPIRLAACRVLKGLLILIHSTKSTSPCASRHDLLLAPIRSPTLQFTAPFPIFNYHNNALFWARRMLVCTAGNARERIQHYASSRNPMMMSDRSGWDL